MMRIRISLLLAIALLSLEAHAGTDPLTNRGIDLNGVFHVGDIDTVNLYSGNLIIDVPLAAQFPLNGGFSYGIHLVYNGQPWDFPMEERTTGGIPPVQSKANPTPSRRSNAGMGWRVSMGRLIAPGDPTNLNCQDETSFQPCGYWMYESPDGADHAIGNSNGPGVISDDGTYLRLKFSSDYNGYVGYEELEFPDGSIHRFDVNGMPTAIYTPFDRAAASGPSVTIDYLTNDATNPCSDTAADSCWRIHDNFSHNGAARAQFVTFKYTPNLYGHQLAQRIIVIAPGEGHVTYTLNYNSGTPYDYHNDPPLHLDTCYDRWGLGEPNQTVPVPLLTSIGLPDGSTYDIETQQGLETDPSFCFQGSITKLTLPTRGSIGYTYLDWVQGARRGIDPPYVPGVFNRTKTAAGGGVPQVWKYEAAKGDPYLDPYLNTEYFSRIVTVTDPDLRVSRHHFSTFSTDNLVTQFSISQGWTPVETGLPFTRGTTTTDPITGETLFLSSEVLDAAGNVERSTYVKYEYDTIGPITEPSTDPAVFRREKASLTRYSENGRWSSVNQSDFDHYGHYRSTVTDGNFATESTTDADHLDRRTEFVNYNPARGTWGTSSFSAWPDGAPWVLNTFDTQWVNVPKTNPNDANEAASHTKKAEFCFDSTTGFPTQRRLLRNDAATADGVARDGADLITVFSQSPDTTDISGNLFSEKTYGGDTAYGATPVSLPTGSLCGLDLSSFTPRYEIRHTYQNGARATSQYFSNGTAMSFKTLDRTIDLSGAVSSENDIAGVSTTYTPDPADPLRIKTVTTPGTADINYSYTNASSTATSFTPAEITVAQSDAASRVQYDSFGRIWREFRTMPGGEVTRETLYDSSNRKLSQSMWDSSSYANKTTYHYDFLGRPDSIDPPDHQTVTTSYTGDSMRTTTAAVIMSTDPAATQTATSTVERMDRYGRIWYLTEPNDTVTAYGYGVTGALARVCMNATVTSGLLSTATCTQERRFLYDNRGFLTNETHPENGTIAYTYDALGHVLTKRMATAGTIFDLNYVYDDAQRLVRIDSLNPYQTSAFRVSKAFTFGADNDGSNLKRGKLETAARHNYQPDLGDIRVTETYAYNDNAGRLTDRTTEIKNVTTNVVNQTITQSQSYSTLGLVNSITYPSCLTIACGTPTSGSMIENYTNGWLSNLADPGIGDYASLGYHPNGMVDTVTHGNGVIDTQANDPNGIPRPQSITFGSFGSCVAPAINNMLDSDTIASGGQKTWFVNASGSGTLVYQWHKDGDSLNVVGTSAFFTTGALTVGHTYYVRVANSCGSVQSNTATVTVAVLPAITIQPQNMSFTAPSVRLTVTATGTSPSYQWYQGASPSTAIPVGANLPYYDTPNLSVTTQYWVHVYNVGGTADSTTATVTITPVLAPPGSLNAVMLTTTSVQVTWSASSGAQHYEIWRREHAGGLHKVGESTTPAYTDSSVAANTAYVYQVCASPSAGTACTSAYSNQDLATTMAFTDLVTDPVIRLAHFNQLLDAVNAVRAANPGSAGTPRTWSDILQGSPPPPAPAAGVVVYGEHILALRRAMDDALQTLLGIAPQPYTDPNLPGSPNVIIKAIHITELRSRTQ